MKIVKYSIREQIYNLIKEDIMLQKIAMGEQINPREIASEHDISVMPVRDALLKLVTQGLVTNKPRVGFFVRDFSVPEIYSVLEVRSMFELFCVEKHFQYIDLAKIKKLKAAAAVNHEDLSRKEFDRIDMELHSSFIMASRNEFLITKYEEIKDLIIFFQHLNPMRMKESHQEHQKIIELIIEGEKQGVTDLMKSHLEQVEEVIIDSMKE